METITKKIRDMSWKEIKSMKNHGYGNPIRIEKVIYKNDTEGAGYYLSVFVFGFCAFVNTNWVEKSRTYKNAFKFFKDEYLDIEVTWVSFS